MKKISYVLIILIVAILLIKIPTIKNKNNKSNKTNNINEMVSNMTNEEKIAQMLMISFRKKESTDINYDNIKNALSAYNYAGVILFAENTPDIESSIKFVDFLQNANKDNKSRLLIAIDQEGGYVTRLGIGTSMPGNMALGATNNPKYAYEAGKIIGKELKALGINTNFAPVVDINSNQGNTVIGVRSFSDDADTVTNFGEQLMKGLQSENIITSLKHFPGHGDTITDTHNGLAIVNKTYDELKQVELKPFQKLTSSDIVMTAHIQFPKIDETTYVSKKDNNTYTLPATLSKKILTDILRNDLGYEGIIVTDALDMKAISENFGLVDASIRAINAGADILLMPFTYDSEVNELKEYVKNLALKVGNEINEENVNNSVKRILKLKEEKGLLEKYDSFNLEESIKNAKNIVSSKENHDKQFEITKKAITMIKNENNVLPLNGDDKTVILYQYSSHIEAVNNALSMLKEEGSIKNSDNISIYPFNSDNLNETKSNINGAKNVILINSLYNASSLSSSSLDKMNEIIDYVHKNNGKAIFMSTHLPYDVTRFNSADAIVLTYLANGIKFNLNDYEKEIPKYGPNVISGIYMLFTKKENMSGVLPINIYSLDNNNNITNKLLYERGFGLTYKN